MANDGITYDAYTLDRWNATTRTDEMQQQTPSRVGAPWDKVTSLGTNMKQIVSGPDGNPTAEFSGSSVHCFIIFRLINIFRYTL